MHCLSEAELRSEPRPQVLGLAMKIASSGAPRSKQKKEEGEDKVGAMNAAAFFFFAISGREEEDESHLTLQ